MESQGGSQVRKPRICVGAKVGVAGYANSRRVKTVDGKYAFVTGIGWGLKSACVLDKTKRKVAFSAERETDFMNEMEMRSAHASFCSQGKGTGEPWMGWSFQRRNYSPVLFCLRVLYGFVEARAEDLYE